MKHGAKWQVITRKRNHVPVYKCFISKAVWLKAMIILGIDCGMRRGEILKLTSKNVSYETGTAVPNLKKFKWLN